MNPVGMLLLQAQDIVSWDPSSYLLALGVATPASGVMQLSTAGGFLLDSIWKPQPQQLSLKLLLCLWPGSAA